jgi:hypothetical protein
VTYDPTTMHTQESAQESHETNASAARGRAALDAISGVSSVPNATLHPKDAPGCRMCFVVGQRTAADATKVGALGDLLSDTAALVPESTTKAPDLFGPTMYFPGVNQSMRLDSKDGGMDALVGQGAEQWMLLLVQLPAQTATLLYDDNDSFRLALDLAHNGIGIVLNSGGAEVWLDDAFATIAGQPVLIEYELRNGVTTLRAGAAGSASVNATRESSFGTLLLATDNATWADAAVVAIAGYGALPDVETRRRVLAWMMDTYGLGPEAIAGW